MWHHYSFIKFSSTIYWKESLGSPWFQNIVDEKINERYNDATFKNFRNCWWKINEKNDHTTFRFRRCHRVKTYPYKMLVFHCKLIYSMNYKYCRYSKASRYTALSCTDLAGARFWIGSKKIWDERIYEVKTLSSTLFWSSCLHPIK